jgi:hypothetical protein
MPRAQVNGHSVAAAGRYNRCHMKADERMRGK